MQDDRQFMYRELCKLGRYTGIKNKKISMFVSVYSCYVFYMQGMDCNKATSLWESDSTIAKIF